VTVRNPHSKQHDIGKSLRYRNKHQPKLTNWIWHLTVNARGTAVALSHGFKGARENGALSTFAVADPVLAFADATLVSFVRRFVIVKRAVYAATGMDVFCREGLATKR